MSSTNFVNGVTLTDADWFNDVDSVTYDGTKGQLLAGGGAGSVAVWNTAGSDRQTLIADSSQSSGLIWTYQDAVKDVLNGVGDFGRNPWQRGTSFSSIADATYCADRFVYSKNGAMVHDVSKASDAPTVAQVGRLQTYCLLADCTTADAALAASDRCHIDYKIEGYDFTTLAQRAFTLSFWHKHTKTGIYSVGFRNSGSDRAYVVEYTQDTTDTWEQATVTITASPSAGTWDYTNGTGLIVSFVLAAGSDSTTSSLNTWNSDAKFASSNQVNACDSTSNNFRLADIRLRPGSFATDVIVPSEQEVVSFCSRYLPWIDVGGWRFCLVDSATDAYASVEFQTPARTAPTGCTAQGNYVVRVVGGGSTPAATIGFNAGLTTSAVLTLGASGMTAGQSILWSGTTGNKILFTGSEL